MKKIITIIGTRPEIIKMFPLIYELDKNFKNKLVYSGQHFNKKMKNIFFEELKIRKPDIDINIINKTKFISEFYLRLVKIVKDYPPDAIIYHGDTYTTLISALTCKIHFPKVKSIHIESGYRSNDPYSIEENIRKTVDYISNINFTLSNKEKNLLIGEGINKNIYAVGNTIFDSIEYVKKEIKKKNCHKYIYSTIHRAENVDNKKRLKSIIKFLNIISKKVTIILSIHPRTKKMIKKFRLCLNKNIKVLNTTSYIKNLNFLYNSIFCITDSGGLQEEAIILKKKCFIPAKSTPHQNYLDTNANELINLSNTKRLLKYIEKPIKIKKFKYSKNVSKKICKILKKII